MTDEAQTIMLSALQHYAYCPRQFALIHVEQAWAENRFTAEGNILHERVDSGVSEQRGNVRSERGVLLKSQRFNLTGKMDLLEIIEGDPNKYFPVEYKRGKPKVMDWDRVQLCAQALCLEEMREISVKEGAIWYWEVRRREPVIFDKVLRETTIVTIENAHLILASGRTPPPIDDKKRCRACSLRDLCAPETFRRDHSTAYISDMFSGQSQREDTGP